MLQTLKLLVPALIPSWRFFDEIAPSPRIEFTLLKTSGDAPDNWQEFRPRPAHLSTAHMLRRLFWNPHWNESLFLVSCAERLMQYQSEHSYQEILKRIREDLAHSPDVAATPYMQFRLMFIKRQGTQLQQDIPFISLVHHYTHES